MTVENPQGHSSPLASLTHCLCHPALSPLPSATQPPLPLLRTHSIPLKCTCSQTSHPQTPALAQHQCPFLSSAHFAHARACRETPTEDSVAVILTAYPHPSNYPES